MRQRTVVFDENLNEKRKGSKICSAPWGQISRVTFRSFASPGAAGGKRRCAHVTTWAHREIVRVYLSKNHRSHNSSFGDQLRQCACDSTRGSKKEFASLLLHARIRTSLCDKGRQRRLGQTALFCLLGKRISTGSRHIAPIVSKKTN